MEEGRKETLGVNQMKMCLVKVYQEKKVRGKR